MKITLIRHGSVEEKYLGCYNGHINISLSDEGLAGAKELATKINPCEYDAVYCSDLKRARETADTLGFEDVSYTKELREKSWGKHEGKSFDEIGIEYKNFIQYINALDGESIKQFSLRVKNFIYNYLTKQNKDNILIITHSGFIKTLLSYHENISLEDAFSKNIQYLSITRIELENI